MKRNKEEPWQHLTIGQEADEPELSVEEVDALLRELAHIIGSVCLKRLNIEIEDSDPDS